MLRNQCIRVRGCGSRWTKHEPERCEKAYITCIASATTMSCSIQTPPDDVTTPVESETLAARRITMEVKRPLPLLLLVVVLCTRPATNQEPATERYTKLLYMCIAKCEEEMLRCARKYGCGGKPIMDIPQPCMDDALDCADDCMITCKKITSH
ncbi:hypothetical protein LSAT2_017704 [Lamellibrachia satsuma]|nr:hypothetical protein LSAT2_017704 [Lamellibrachia satsuma]